MKLSFLFIGTILTFFVTATPLVIPRSLPYPFQLVVTGAPNGVLLNPLEAIAVPGTDYFRVGWGGGLLHSPAVFVFTANPFSPGSVRDTKQSDYYLAFTDVSTDDSIKVYELVVVNFAKTTTHKILESNNFYASRKELLYQSDDDLFWQWYFCDSREGGRHVYFATAPPTFCNIAGVVTLKPRGPGWN